MSEGTYLVLSATMLPIVVMPFGELSASKHHWRYIVMPSFIHTSRQSFGDTESPYHWWMLSWVMTGADNVYSLLPSVSIVWVSIALFMSTTTRPSESNGSGPRWASSQSTA